MAYVSSKLKESAPTLGARVIKVHADELDYGPRDVRMIMELDLRQLQHGLARLVIAHEGGERGSTGVQARWVPSLESKRAILHMQNQHLKLWQDPQVPAHAWRDA
jgi:hypothetical protein